MPATIPKTTAAAEPTSPSLLARLLKVQPHVKRFVVWSSIALVGTYAMGSAVNHFFSGGNGKSQDAHVVGSAQGQTSSGGSYGGWWNPSGEDSHSSSDSNRGSDESGSGTSSGSVSVIPANTGVPVYSGTLSLTNLAPIGLNSSQHAYDVLGLRTGNTPLLTTSPTVASSSTGSDAPLATFSLSGNMSLVPTNNLEAGGLNMTTALVPEPTTAAMLAVGLAGLALSRRRRAWRAA